MDEAREREAEFMKRNENAILDRYVWKDEYSYLPESVKDDLKKRIFYAHTNYRFAKQRNEYFTLLWSGGLSPQNMHPASGYLYLFSGLYTDWIISTWILIDKKINSNGLLGLRTKINDYATEYSMLKIDDIEGNILNSPDLKGLKINRNNIIGHSNINILEHLTNNTFSIDSMNSCLDEIFNILKTINDHYFETTISDGHNLSMDKAFTADLLDVIQKSQQ